MYLVSTIGKEALPDVNESGLFNYPCGICEDTFIDNVFYVADKNNNCVKKIDEKKRITTVLRGLNNPTSIVSTTTGFYVSDTGNNRVIKLDTNFNTIRQFTGFNSPKGMCAGNFIKSPDLSRWRVFVCDTNNHVIKMINDDDNTVTLVSGVTGQPGYDYGNIQAKYSNPHGIYAVNYYGIAMLYIADTGNNLVRKFEFDTYNFSTSSSPVIISGSILVNLSIITQTTSVFTGISGNVDGGVGTSRLNGPSKIKKYKAGIDASFFVVIENSPNKQRRLHTDSGCVETIPDGTSVNQLLGGSYSFFNDKSIPFVSLDYERLPPNERLVCYFINDSKKLERRYYAPNYLLGVQSGYYLNNQEEIQIPTITLNNPTDVTVIGDSLYITDTGNNRVLRINKITYAVSHIYTGFNSPKGIDSVRLNGGVSVVFVADTNNHVIKRIDPGTNGVSIIAGESGQQGSVIGFSSDARFSFPEGIAVKNRDNKSKVVQVYVADTGNNVIRYFEYNTETGVSSIVTIISGSYTSDGAIPAIVQADCQRPIDLSSNPRARLTLSEKYLNTISTTRGYRNGNYSNGLSNQPLADRPTDIIAIDETLVYFMDSGNRRLRLISDGADPTTSSFAGSVDNSYTDGTLTNCSFYSVNEMYMCRARNGKLYISDSAAHTIRMVDPSLNFVSTYAGTFKKYGDRDDAIKEFTTLEGISVDIDNNLYVTDSSADEIKKIQPNDKVISLLNLESVKVAPLLNDDGSYYVCDDRQGNSSGWGIISKIIPSSSSVNIITTFPEDVVLDFISILKDSAGTLYVFVKKIDYTTDVFQVNESNGTITTFAQNISGTSGVYINQNSVSYDGTRNVFYFSVENHTIKKLDLSTRLITTIAGGTSGYEDGNGSTAKFNNPSGVFYDQSSDVLYIADTGNKRIRAINLANSGFPVTTIAGNGVRGYKDGFYKNANFNNPKGITVKSGAIYCTDDDRVKKIIDLTYKNLGRGVIHGNDMYIPSISNNGIIKIQNINSDNPIKTLWVSSTTIPSINRPSSLLIDGTNMYITNTGTSSISVLENFDTTPTHRFLGINPAVLNLKNADGSLTPINYMKIFDFPSSMISLGEDLYVVNSGNSTLVKVENFRTASKRAILVANGERNKFTLVMKETMYFDPSNQPTDGTVRFYFKKNINLTNLKISHLKFSSETIYFKITSSSFDSTTRRTNITGNFIDDNDNTIPGIIVPEPSSTSTASEFNWTVLLGNKNVMVSQTYTLDNPVDIDMYGSDLYISNLGSRDRNSFITKFGNLTSFRNFIANADRFLGGDLFGMKIHGDHIYASTMNFETGVTRIIRFKVRPWAGSYIFATNESSGGTYNDIIPDNSVVTEIYIPESGSDMYLQVYNFSGGGWDLIRIKNFQ